MSDQRSNQASIQAFMPKVTGSTDVYLIVGDPVAQVRAPEIFNPIFASMAIDAVLVPVLVAPQHLQTLVKTVFLAPNIKGLVVAIPHKAPMMGLLDVSSELGTIAGAVNGVRRNADGSIEGGQFDGEGFVASLAYFNIAYANKRVLIVGAGGGGTAIGASLAVARSTGAAREVALFDIVPGKAQQVAARIAAATGIKIYAAASSDPTGFDVVVNATPLGLKLTDPMPCDVTRLEPHAALVDIVMKNQPTPVVRAARARGLNAQPGFEMLIQQVHLYLDFFGFAAAARHLRDDASFLREKIYPAEMKDEIRRPFKADKPADKVAVPASPY